MNGCPTQTQKPLVSIVMPAYNVDDYIAQTIECLLCQTVGDLEILVIDDGSTDDTSNVVLACELRDERVRLFRTGNGGPSRARNIGIDKANGRYLMFIDSDDVVAPDFVETLISLLIKYDCQCSACGITTYRGEAAVVSGHHDPIIYDDYSVKYLALEKPRGFLANKAFLASLIADKHLRLREDIHQSEDMLFLLDYLSFCERAAYVEDIKYFYRQRKGSLTNTLKNENWFDVLTVFEAYKDRFTENPDGSEAVKRNFLPVAYEGKYRYRATGIENQNIKRRLKSMLDYCESSLYDQPLKIRLKMFFYRHCMSLIMYRRLSYV